MGETKIAAAAVTVCRDCCCGQSAKHPRHDHDAQLELLRTSVNSQVKVSRCLGVCQQSNVIVVSPSPAARRAGARPIWLGGVLDLASTQDVIEWANAGGPGVVPLPPILELHAIPSPD